jgi:hypothetical protein
MIKPCPVEKYTFIQCCFKAASELLSKEDYDSLNLVHDGWMPTAVAAKECKLSQPTFSLRARQWLMPDKYGKLPEEFFGDRDLFDPPPQDDKVPIIFDDKRQMFASELPKLRG